MTKKRRAPLRLSPADAYDADADKGREAGPRAAPNTNFLGRLVRGVATGNQRRINATTSGAANMSIGATGAASLRLQLHQARSARFQTLRRVVLSSAEKQRLTLCTALLAEVAQGFGFRLTVRQPDGHEVSARQAMEAAVQLHSQPFEQEDHEPGVSVMDADAGLQAGDGRGGDGATGGGGVGGALAPDTVDVLAPLSVELGLGLEPGDKALSRPSREPLKSLVGAGLATRLPSSPSGLRPARGSLAALLSGRLMSTALTSMGLLDTRKVVAAQAVQAAKRRALTRAASNSAADEACTAAMNAARVPPHGRAVNPAGDGMGLESVAPGSDAKIQPVPVPASTAAVSSGSSRRIVWNPDKLPKMAAAGTTQLYGNTAIIEGQQDPVPAAPPAKRARTSVAAVATSHGAAAESVEVNGGGFVARASVGRAVDHVAAATTPAAAAAADDTAREGEAAEKRVGLQAVAHGEAGLSAASRDVENLGLSESEQGLTGQDREQQQTANPGGGSAAGAVERAADGLATTPITSGIGGSHEDVDGDSYTGGPQRRSRTSSAEASDALVTVRESRSKPKQVDGSAAAAAQDSRPVRSSMVNEVALAGPAALAGSAAASGPGRPRAPIHTASIAAVAVGLTSRTGSGAAATTAVSPLGDTEMEDDPNSTAATAASNGEDDEGLGAELAPATGPDASTPAVGARRAAGTGSPGEASGKKVASGAPADPARKLFGAAMRQLKQRSQS
ncbi:hypothetical protein VaNZ11_007070 [Volvox africanus]|uniref:Uncharacterized protein n=1 Tax=Volvox africanus TaxID=51714 RepID=A0ABQ5S2G2_9CHLO|nr:hypothetical protein VaNZ11_007070 [Volvox africanus]